MKDIKEDIKVGDLVGLGYSTDSPFNYVGYVETLKTGESRSNGKQGRLYLKGDYEGGWEGYYRDEYLEDYPIVNKLIPHNKPDSIEAELEAIRDSIADLADELKDTGAEPILNRVYEELGKALEALEE